MIALVAAALAFVAALLYVRLSPREQVLTHEPTATPTRVPVLASDFIKRQWTLALPELQNTHPERSIVVMRRSPLRGSLETPALSKVVYVFVHADGRVADILTDARAGDLLEHDGIIRTFAPRVIQAGST